MKVTRIQQQVKRATRYSIFIDHKYFTSLPESELIELELKVGQQLTQSEIDSLGNKAEFDKAKNACLRLLSYRARSEGEIRDYLHRKKYNPEIAAKTIEYLTSKAFLNDEQFAQQWTENRVVNRRASVRQIRNELRKKQIAAEIISKVLEDQQVDEVELIREIVEKKRSQSKYKDDLKLMQYLSRKGFSYDKILLGLGRRTE